MKKSMHSRKEILEGSLIVMPGHAIDIPEAHNRPYRLTIENFYGDSILYIMGAPKKDGSILVYSRNIQLYRHTKVFSKYGDVWESGSIESLALPPEEEVEGLSDYLANQLWSDISRRADTGPVTLEMIRNAAAEAGAAIGRKFRGIGSAMASQAAAGIPFAPFRPLNKLDREEALRLMQRSFDSCEEGNEEIEDAEICGPDSDEGPAEDDENSNGGGSSDAETGIRARNIYDAMLIGGNRK